MQRGVFDQTMALMEVYAIEVLTFDDQQCRLALAAFRKYGKGRHAAGLNFGDCCSYAAAASLAWPLLFKGNEFPLTDISPALA